MHLIVDWLNIYSPNKVPETLFLDETVVRARMLASELRRLFPTAKLIWRDSFFNHLSPTYEELNVKLRNSTNSIFLGHGFHLLPGYRTTLGKPSHEPHEDGFHSSAAVVDLLLSMLATLVCPNATYDDQ